MDFKFGRNYQLSITTALGEILEIEPPFSVEFDVTRNMMNDANKASFRIYNLSEVTRNQIRRDPWSGTARRPVAFRAGYGDKLSEVFIGNLSQAWSVREGVDYITQVECIGGMIAYTNGFFSNQFPAGTSTTTMIRTIMESLQRTSGVTTGVIGDFPGTISRGISMVGSSMELLKDLTGANVFIDNNKIYCLNLNECLVGDISVIDSDFGVLATPIKEEQGLNLEIVFEPRLKIAQLIELELSRFTDQNSSSTNQRTGQFNGAYQVIQLHHKGIISEAVAGSATTSVKLWYGNQLLQEVIGGS